MKRVIHFSNVSGRESRFDATADGAIDKLHGRRRDGVDHQYDVWWATQERHKPNISFSSAPRELYPNGMSRLQYEAYLEEESKRTLLYPKDSLLSTNKDSTRMPVSFTKAPRRIGVDQPQTHHVATKNGGGDGESDHSTMKSGATTPERRLSVHERYREEMRNYVVFPDIRTGGKPHVNSACVFDKLPGRDGKSPLRGRDFAARRAEERQSGAASAPLEASPAATATATNATTEAPRAASQLGHVLFPSVRREAPARAGEEPEHPPTTLEATPNAESNPAATSPRKATFTKRHAVKDVLMRMTLDEEAPMRHVKAPLFRSYMGRQIAPMHQLHKETLEYDVELHPDKGRKLLSKSREMPMVAFTKAPRFPAVVSSDEITRAVLGESEEEGEQGGAGGVASQGRRRSRIRWEDGQPVLVGGDDVQTAPTPKNSTGRMTRDAAGQSAANKRTRKAPQKSAYTLTGGRIQVDLNVIFNGPRFKELLREHDARIEEANFADEQRKPKRRVSDDDADGPQRGNNGNDSAEDVDGPSTYDEALAMVEKREAVDRLKHLTLTRDDCAMAYDGSLPKRKPKGIPDLFLGPIKFDPATAHGVAPADPYERLQPSNKRSVRLEAPELPELLLEAQARRAFEDDVRRERGERRAEREAAAQEALAAAAAKRDLQRFNDDLTQTVTASSSGTSSPSPAGSLRALPVGKKGAGISPTARERTVQLVSPETQSLRGGAPAKGPALGSFLSKSIV